MCTSRVNSTEFGHRLISLGCFRNQHRADKITLITAGCQVNIINWTLLADHVTSVLCRLFFYSFVFLDFVLISTFELLQCCEL